MGEDGPTAIRDASACFDNLLAFADAREDHLLAALLTDAWSHFEARHQAEIEGGNDMS